MPRNWNNGRRSTSKCSSQCIGVFENYDEILNVFLFWFGLPLEDYNFGVTRFRMLDADYAVCLLRVKSLIEKIELKFEHV